MAHPAERPHLVGPDLYPTYLLVLKITLAAVIGAAFVAAAVHAVQAGGGSADPFVRALGVAWNGAFVAVGAVTLVFTLAQHHPEARAKLMLAGEPLQRLQAIGLRPHPRGALHHLAAILAQSMFLLWWTGAIQPWRDIPLQDGGSLTLDLAPVWSGLYLPVLGLSAGVILVNALRLAKATTRRLDHALDLSLQLMLLAVAVIALRGGDWVDVTASGMAGDAVAQIGRGANAGAQAVLIAIVATSVALAAAHLWGLVRRTSTDVRG